MSKGVIKVEGLGKLYRLGEVGTGTISHDLNRWWANIRGREDPFSKVGTVNDRTQKAKEGEYSWALKDINFEVQPGEVLGIIGRNGAGKSTLLKLLSRVTAPTVGNIKIKGRVASLLEVGTGFHPEMTGRENIYMNGTILGMTRSEISSKLDDIVDFAGIAKYLDTPTKRYSSGMQVRLAFAVAAFLEPEILIVDEVLAVGDAEFQKRAIGKIQEVSKGEGRTVLFVSHNMASVDKICTTGLLIDNGSIKFEGQASDVINYYNKSLNKSIVGSQVFSDNEYVNHRYNISFTGFDCHAVKRPDGEFDLKIVLHFHSKMKNKGMGIGFAIRTENNLIVCQQGAVMTGIKLDDLLGDSSISLQIENISQYLTGGTYFVDIKLVIPKVESIINAESIGSFNIPEKDTYGNGFYLNSTRHGSTPLKLTTG